MSEGTKVAVIGSAAAVAFLAIAVWMGVLITESSKQYADWCAGQGGHVDSHTDTHAMPVTTVDGKGGVHVGVGTTSSTITFCLSEDGRILDVR